MAGIIPGDELRRLQRRMNRLMEDWGLTKLESRYLEEMQRIQKRIEDLMKESEVTSTDRDIITPLVDIRETEEAIILVMDLPGVDKQDVDINIVEGKLHIVAERRSDTEVSEKEYHKRERIYTKFDRILNLPVAVKAEEANAKLTNGILEVTLPKEIITAKRRISIE
ncbi:MAG: Hsp20/alpha crystallin family protein [Methanotrichaceae archaeon]|nr:Hsp20/alpha crystallin family protein [Methanotrichaceae archaeon]